MLKGAPSIYCSSPQYWRRYYGCIFVTRNLTTVNLEKKLERKQKMLLKHENGRHVTGLKLTTDICSIEILFLPNPVWFESHKNQCLFTRHEPTLLFTRHLTNSDNLWPEVRLVPVFRSVGGPSLSPLQSSVDPYLLLGQFYYCDSAPIVWWLFSAAKPRLFSKSCARNLQYRPITFYIAYFVIWQNKRKCE